MQEHGCFCFDKEPQVYKANTYYGGNTNFHAIVQMFTL